jgi:hypothetical protein
MYDLSQFSGDGYYAVGGDTPLQQVRTYATANINLVLALVVVLVVLVIALFLGYLAPYKKEGLISGSMASLGIGGSQRSDYGTPGDMVIVPNYGSSEGFASDGLVRQAKGLGAMSANEAAAVIAGQPCSKTILTSDDAWGWMHKTAWEGESEQGGGQGKEKYAQPNDAQLTASMKGY